MFLAAYAPVAHGAEGRTLIAWSVSGAAGALAPGTAPATMDELAGYTSCLDLSPGLLQMHWKVQPAGWKGLNEGVCYG